MLLATALELLANTLSGNSPFGFIALPEAGIGCKAVVCVLLDKETGLLVTTASAVARLLLVSLPVTTASAVARLRLVFLRSSDEDCRSCGLGRGTFEVARTVGGRGPWGGGLGRGTRLKSGGALDVASSDLSSDLS